MTKVPSTTCLRLAATFRRLGLAFSPCSRHDFWIHDDGHNVGVAIVNDMIYVWRSGWRTIPVVGRRAAVSSMVREFHALFRNPDRRYNDWAADTTEED